MFCERILGRIDPSAPADADPPIDWLDLTWLQCTQRALRTRTRAGVDVRLLLPIAQTPGHGDVLFQDELTTIAIHLLPADVLVARPPTPAALARLAIELGNLHVPTEVSGEELILIPDGPTEAALRRHKTPFHQDRRRFVPERSSVSSIATRAADLVISRRSGAAVGYS